MDRKEITDAFYKGWYDTFDCKNAVDTVLNHPGVRDYRVTYDMYTNEKIVKAFNTTEDVRANRKEIDEMNKKERVCGSFTFDTYGIEIEKVIFNDPATIILWKDGTKTIVKCCEYDEYDPYVGVSMAINKKLLGDDYKRIFKKALSFYEEPEEEEWDETYEWNTETESVNNLKIKLDELKQAFGKLNLQSADYYYGDNLLKGGKR